MATRTSQIEASTVIESICRANTKSKRIAADNLLESYVKQRRRCGIDPMRCRAAIQAHVTRRTQ